ncbi:formyl transferase [Halteromyces radiatus]|uniref:formyl transferase n=1 Tax=Halteromyces radiatus TaxID=101107 RepID=UPI00221E3E9F|nr:formyl transferase [Halteromyces radiatus]KAI8098512.1 formyl transferase [Halteromyces radiatus]
MTLLTHFTLLSFRSIPKFTCTRYYSSTTTRPLRILFFGTDDFASTHLKALIKEKNHKNSCIASLDLVCPPDSRTGRKLNTLTPSATKGLAELYNIPVQHTPAKAESLDNWNIENKNNIPYDLGVVVSFGYFIPPHIIDSFRYGAINVHPSLLPKFRGAAPIQHTILQGENETGVTVQELDDKEFDAGRILAQTKVDLSTDHAPTYKDLSLFLANVGSDLLLDTLRNFEDRKKNAKTQDISQATKAPKIKKEWANIDFDLMASWQIEQLHRAIGEQYPLRVTFTFSRIKRSLKVKQNITTLQLSHIHLPLDSPFYDDHHSTFPPGTFMLDKRTKTLHIMCADGQVIGVTHLKAENKNAITAKDFINGYEIRHTGQFNINVDPSTVKPGQSGVRITKRREFYEKTIRKRLGIRKEVYNKIYKA